MDQGRLERLKERARAAFERFQHDPDDLQALDLAISTLKEALDIAGVPSAHRASLLTSLGVMLTERYQVGHEPQDLEDGILAYRDAVAAADEKEAGYATYLCNLGSGLYEYFVATRGSEVRREAFEVLDRARALICSDSPKYPALAINFGAVVFSLADDLADSTVVAEAIDVLRDALRPPPDAHRTFQLRQNLAALLALRYDLEGNACDLKEAITLNQKLLSTDDVPLDRPRVHSNLGNALLREYRRNHEDLDLLRDAITQHTAAVATTRRTRAAALDYRLNLGETLALLAERTGTQHDHDRAITALEDAWSWIDEYLGRAPLVHRIGVQDTLMRLSARLAVMLTRRRGDSHAAYARALEISESAKSRLLAQRTGWAPIAPPPELDSQTATREATLVHELQDLESYELIDREAWPPPAGAWGDAAERSQRRRDALSELTTLWREIERAGPQGASFVTLRRGSSTSVAELVQACRLRSDGTMLLSVVSAPDETLFLLLDSESSQIRAVSAPIGDDAWADIARRLHREIPTSRGDDRGERWLEPLIGPCRELREHLLGAQRLVISPHRRSHAVPWSVLACRAGWQLPTGESLPVVSIPSLSLLPRIRAQRDTVARSLVVGDPRGDLRYAATEALEVAAIIGEDRPLIGPEARLSLIEPRLRSSRLAHIAAHATFSDESPLDSHILLHDGELRARQILRSQLDLDLLVLSACESGVSEPIVGNELMGLSHAFLAAGVRSLVVTLWPVNDRSTQVFMQTFHEELAAHADRAAALASAAAVLREHPDWSHPYYWGAFTLLGAWW